MRLSELITKIWVKIDPVLSAAKMLPNDFTFREYNVYADICGRSRGGHQTTVGLSTTAIIAFLLAICSETLEMRPALRKQLRKTKYRYCQYCSSCHVVHGLQFLAIWTLCGNSQGFHRNKTSNDNVVTRHAHVLRSHAEVYSLSS